MYIEYCKRVRRHSKQKFENKINNEVYKGTYAESILYNASCIKVVFFISCVIIEGVSNAIY